MPERCVPVLTNLEDVVLDNINGYAVDKVKFAMELAVWDVEALNAEFEEVFGSMTGPQGGRTYNVVAVKKGAVDGTYLYLFDIWGEAAALVDNLNFGRWYPHIDRVDLKVTMPMTPDGRDNYHAYLKDKVGNKRSIGMRDSPPRQKRGGRDAGGHTLALGSHKSDFRVHWTLRTDEVGYQEFQLEGSRITTGIELQRYYGNNQSEYPGKFGWQQLMQQLLTNSQIELQELDGLYDSDRASILAGAMDIHGVIERKLDYLEYQINMLPRDALYALYQALEQKLFGEPQPPSQQDLQRAVDFIASKQGE